MTQWYNELTQDQRDDPEYESIEDELLYIEDLSIVARIVRDNINRISEEVTRMAKKKGIPIVIPDFFASDETVKNSHFEWSTSGLYC